MFQCNVLYYILIVVLQFWRFGNIIKISVRYLKQPLKITLMSFFYVTKLKREKKSPGLGLGKYPRALAKCEYLLRFLYKFQCLAITALRIRSFLSSLQKKSKFCHLPLGVCQNPDKLILSCKKKMPTLKFQIGAANMTK